MTRMKKNGLYRFALTLAVAGGGFACGVRADPVFVAVQDGKATGALAGRTLLRRHD